jgi:hypothetical protein
MPKKLRIGILGYGRMGSGFVAAMQENDLWDVAAVYDIRGQTRRLARQQVPNAAICDDPDAVFRDLSIDAVGLFTLADARPQHNRQALANHKHVLAEKPLGTDVPTEWRLVREIEASDRLVAVNLFNRNAWYHKDIALSPTELKQNCFARTRARLARILALPAVVMGVTGWIPNKVLDIGPKGPWPWGALLGISLIHQLVGVSPSLPRSAVKPGSPISAE